MPAVRLFRVTGGTVNPEPEPPERPAPVPAIRQRGRQGAVLTPRQCEALTHIAHGDSGAEAAWHCGMALHTLNNHLRAVYAYLGARSAAHAVAIAMARGLIVLDADDLVDPAHHVMTPIEPPGP